MRRLGGEPGASAALVSPLLIGARVRALAGSSDTVAVAGGDGTMRSAAEALLGTGAALLPIPAGTVNTFARRSGVETVDAALRLLHAPGRRSVPVGVANERVFLNTATFGLYARVVRLRDRIGHWIGRWPAAGVALANTVARLRRFDLEITTPHTRLMRSTPLLWIRVLWAEDGGPQLELVIFHLSGRAAAADFLLRRGPVLARGNVPADDPRLEVLRTGSLIVRAAHAIDITLDGEPFRVRPPVFVGLQEDALSIVSSAHKNAAGYQGINR